MRFTINLATKTYLDYRKINQACVAGLIILAILLAWNVTSISWNLGDLRRTVAENTSLEARLNARPPGVSEKDYSRTMNRIHFYNGIIERKTYNWLELLDQLENVTPAGVALVSLVPDKKDGGLTIEGRTKNFDMLKNYLGNFESSKYFTNVLLLSHHDLAIGEKTRGVQFTLSCRTVMR